MKEITKRILRYILQFILMVAGATLGAYLVSLFLPDIRTEGKMPSMIFGTCLGFVLSKITTYIKEKGKNSEA
ncbi:MAG: hypothetical protein E7261_06830 [Lachnospiraceae bacterium]|nr:hypothetical protein [Lachnospiraceae bacterium]